MQVVVRGLEVLRYGRGSYGLRGLAIILLCATSHLRCRCDAVSPNMSNALTMLHSWNGQQPTTSMDHPAGSLSIPTDQ